MTRLVAIAVIAAWFVCGLISTGGMMAKYQRQFCELNTRAEYRDNLVWWAVIGAVTGPTGLLATVATTGAFRHGWTLKYEGQCKTP